jgi:hypothetical protein
MNTPNDTAPTTQTRFALGDIVTLSSEGRVRIVRVKKGNYVGVQDARWPLNGPVDNMWTLGFTALTFAEFSRQFRAAADGGRS